MISTEDSVRTFLECISIGSAKDTDKDTEQNNKIQEILKKSIYDLCFVMVPDVDSLVNEKGVFKPSSLEHGAVMKAFFGEQRKVIFSIFSGIAKLKEQDEKDKAELRAEIEVLRGETIKMGTRMKAIMKNQMTS